MSKAPTLKQPPFSSHRSVSVREQPLGNQSSHLPRSTTTYHGGSAQETVPVEIGSKGSIFSLVGRDTFASRGANVETASKEKVANFHIWHNRLWLVIPSASKKLNTTKKTAKGPALEVEEERKQESRVPKWKKVLHKLKGGSDDNRFKGKQRGHSETVQNQSEKSTLDKYASVPLSRSIEVHSPHTSDTRVPHLFVQTEVSPKTPIWERRNFAQISPLDFSHFQTARLKKAFARPVPLG